MHNFKHQCIFMKISLSSELRLGDRGTGQVTPTFIRRQAEHTGHPSVTRPYVNSSEAFPSDKTGKIYALFIISLLNKFTDAQTLLPSSFSERY